MTQETPEGTTGPEQLLDMWMGADTPPQPPTAPHRHRGLTVFGIIVLVIAAGLLARTALDIALLLAAFVVAVFVLHAVLQGIARSVLLSPGSVVILALLSALLVWIVVPNAQWARWSQRVPRPVAAALKWAEDHGLGKAALIPTADEPYLAAAPASEPVEPTAATTPTTATAGAVSPASGPRVTLSSVSGTSRVGEPVMFTARVTGLDPKASGATVRFYDGGALLGSAVVRTEGQVRVAYLTVATLAVGAHEIHAELREGVTLTGVPSPPLPHTVAQER